MLAFRLARFAIGWASAVVGFLQIAVRFCHGFYLSKSIAFGPDYGPVQSTIFSVRCEAGC
jgi:hypothetical protein